jgi:hypothetical protein
VTGSVPRQRAGLFQDAGEGKRELASTIAASFLMLQIATSERGTPRCSNSKSAGKRRHRVELAD